MELSAANRQWCVKHEQLSGSNLSGNKSQRSVRRGKTAVPYSRLQVFYSAAFSPVIIEQDTVWMKATGEGGPEFLSVGDLVIEVTILSIIFTLTD